MNRQIALAFVIATAAAGNAFADDITVESTPFSSTMSRAQVQTELQQARQSGMDPWAQHYDHLAGFRSERSRAAATAEYIAERSSVAAFGGEDSGSMVLARSARPASITRVAALVADTE